MEEEKDKINEIFELLTQWYHLPKYQLERRLDIFFALYLPEILETKEIYNITPDKIFPEFPLRKLDSNQSNNVDYAIIYEEKQEYNLCLIELKTDMNSIKEPNPQKPGQIEYYQAVQKKSPKEILNGIIEIFNSSRGTSKGKYEYLLESLSDKDKVNIVEKEGKKWRIREKIKYNEKIRIIYIVPDNTKNEIVKEVTDENNIITFHEICNKVLKEKDDKISKRFKKLLEDIISK